MYLNFLKKRYGQWIINDGGVKCDKVDVKGVAVSGWKAVGTEKTVTK